jgi:hypothetical protein
MPAHPIIAAQAIGVENSSRRIISRMGTVLPSIAFVESVILSQDHDLSQKPKGRKSASFATARGLD